jgi:ketol-acid reductoisomerase
LGAEARAVDEQFTGNRAAVVELCCRPCAAEPAEAVKGADIIAILTPDMAQAQVYRDIIEPNAKKGAAILFAHGFSILYGRVTPRADMDVILVAPKGPGDLVRREYARGRGVPALFAVEQDATGKARDRAMGYA